MNESRTTPDTPVSTALFARSVLGIAAEVERAEANIKTAILNAASAGDCQAVIDIVSRWVSEPVVEVAAVLNSASDNDGRNS